MTPTHVALTKTLSGLAEIIHTHMTDNPGHNEGIPDDIGLPYLLKMIATAEQELENWPVDKTGRWIGYIQGVLTVRKIITVKEERDRTRPFFHEAYASSGIKIPETKEL